MPCVPRTLRAVCVPILLLPLVACGDFGESDAEATLRERQSLTVLTLNTPTTYYIDRTGAAEGYEYRLTQALARAWICPLSTRSRIPLKPFWPVCATARATWRRRD